jgi:hypothetical protein
MSVSLLPRRDKPSPIATTSSAMQKCPVHQIADDVVRACRSNNDDIDVLRLEEKYC